MYSFKFQSVGDVFNKDMKKGEAGLLVRWEYVLHN